MIYEKVIENVGGSKLVFPVFKILYLFLKNYNMNFQHSEITGKIIKSFYKVYNNLGYGFLEKVYENALFIELINDGFFVEKQKRVRRKKKRK